MATRTTILLSALIGFLAFSEFAFAIGLESEEVIKKFLASHESNQEGTETQGSRVEDLDGDGKPEIILVWTLLGPTYWRNTLTVFTSSGKGYKVASSVPLVGEAKLSSVENGRIVVDQTIYAKDDPICCPSINKKISYRWRGKRYQR